MPDRGQAYCKRHPARRIRGGSAGSAQRSKPQHLTRHKGRDNFREGSKNSASKGQGSNMRLQWRRGTLVCAAECEIDQQGYSILGLADKRQRPEIDDLEKWTSATPRFEHVRSPFPRSHYIATQLSRLSVEATTKQQRPSTPFTPLPSPPFPKQPQDQHQMKKSGRL